MPRADSQPIFVPTLLDRLLDDEPESSSEPNRDRFFSVAEFERAVRRDLEALLNTRQEALGELPPEFDAIGQSLLSYGLPDLTSMSLANTNDRNRVRTTLEQTVRTFEPRLTRVRVFLDEPRKNERALRFRIEALLRTDPAPESVSFDAVLQLATQEYTIEEGT